MKLPARLLASLLSPLLVAASAQSILRGSSEAPPLLECEEKNQRYYGAWDDAFVCNEADRIILRRGDSLYSHSMCEDNPPMAMSKTPTLDRTQIIACIPSGGKLWAFLNSRETGAFAIDINSGQISNFKVPHRTIADAPAPGTRIRSHVAVRHAGSVILMIEGGNPQTWPREANNHPVYFWMSLESGRVVRFPIGWDLEYFSQDQHTAIFATPQPEAFQPRPLQAVTMQTGEYSDVVPDRNAEGYVVGGTQEVQPVYMHRPPMRSRAFFKGLSVNGRVLLFNRDLDKSDKTFYPLQTMEIDGFIGFRLHHTALVPREPSPLWLMRAEDPAIPERVAPLVTDFAILKDGNCVYTVTGNGDEHKASSEVFFRAFDDKSTWNVLDGVPRLPEIEQEFAGKSFVEDRMKVRLIKGFGTRSPIVLCLFQHDRRDWRALAEGKRLKTELWGRAVILTSKGERCMTSLFREEPAPDMIWLHSTGRLFTGVTEGAVIHLYARDINLPLDPD
jgi:hypothetical protein